MIGLLPSAALYNLCVISAEFTRPQPLPLTMLVIQNFSPIIAIERQTKVNLRTSTEELTQTTNMPKQK